MDTAVQLDTLMETQLQIPPYITLDPELRTSQKTPQGPQEIDDSQKWFTATFVLLPWWFPLTYVDHLLQTFGTDSVQTAQKFRFPAVRVVAVVADFTFKFLQSVNQRAVPGLHLNTPQSRLKHGTFPSGTSRNPLSYEDNSSAPLCPLDLFRLCCYLLVRINSTFFETYLKFQNKQWSMTESSHLFIFWTSLHLFLVTHYSGTLELNLSSSPKEKRRIVVNI